jgi:hypothetical protein
MADPDMARHAPQALGRPGGAVAALDIPGRGEAPSDILDVAATAARD